MLGCWVCVIGCLVCVIGCWIFVIECRLGVVWYVCFWCLGNVCCHAELYKLSWLLFSPLRCLGLVKDFVCIVSLLNMEQLAESLS